MRPEHPVARRIAAQAHSDLLALERTIGDNGKLRTEIAVADVRRTIAFFGSTAGEGGWRVCIVDSVDELNRFGTNALLKILEEPPARVLAVPAVSHAPGQVLPTIRSRCRRLLLRPLQPDDVARAAAEVARSRRSRAKRCAAPQRLPMAASPAPSHSSTGRASRLHDGVATLLARLPDVDPRALHSLGDGLGRANEGAFETFLTSVRDWLSTRLAYEREPARMARVASVWEKFNQAAADVAVFNLERKPLVFSTFGMLAELARG